MQHVTVYRDPGRYAGWPANYGIWSWGDEIVVGFVAGYPDPASVRLGDGRLLVAVRCRGPEPGSGAGNWIDLYASADGGADWRYLNRPVPDTGWGGNPPTLTLLHDGRLCLTYGCRREPYGMRARLSADSGATWGEEIVLRSDAGSHDVGYPRTVQRPDGTIVTVYYYNDRPGGEGYIAATLWRA